MKNENRKGVRMEPLEGSEFREERSRDRITEKDCR